MQQSVAMQNWYQENKERVLFYKKAMYRLEKHKDNKLIKQYREIYYNTPEEPKPKKKYKPFDSIRRREYKKAYYHLNKNNDSSYMEAYKLKWKKRKVEEQKLAS